MEERDVIVIGGGPAGYAAAIRLAQLGRKATVIEKGTLGGTCLNRGCVPAMVMTKAIELLDQAKAGKDYGIVFPETTIDFEKLNGRKKTVTKIHVGGVKALLDAYGVELVLGGGRFVSPSEIEISEAEGGKRRLSPRQTIVAAGTIPAPATISGDAGSTIDTDRLLELSAAPPSILFIGGGAVALTLATIFSRLGSQATVIEESERVLPEIDQEIVEILRKELKKSKIQVMTGGRPVRIDGGPDGEIEVEIETKSERVKVKAACVVRMDRKPDIEALGLTAIGIRLNERGGIQTNLSMETTVNGIFAAGDVTMNHLCTPVAYAEGLTAAENIAGKKCAIDYSAIPCWSSTIPPVCGAGLTEADAISKGFRVRVGRFPMAANGMATVLGRRVGMVKIVTDAGYGQILGVHVIGQNAPELVHEALLAMKSELTPEEIGRVCHVHPSLSEAFWDAARAVNGASINSIAPGG